MAIKAAKLWLSMVAVFLVILAVSFAEAKSLRKGEEYKEKSGEAIRVVSSDEVEIERGPDILLGKYTVDGERVRIVINALGTAMVRYYKIIPDGLIEEKGGTIYYSKAGIANMRKRVHEEALAAKYKDNGNGTVTDNDTKLMWQKKSDKMEPNPAISYCKKLSLAGYNDWRLPNVGELKSIIGIRGTFVNFPTHVERKMSYWLSNTGPTGTSIEWDVNFYGDYADGSDKTGVRYVRCVRSEQ